MGNFAFILLLGLALVIGAWMALEVRLLLVYPDRFTVSQKVIGWAVVAFALAVGLGMAALAALCLRWR